MQVIQFSCSICLSDYIEPTNLPCGHTFCAKCISETLGKQQCPTCPICRKPIVSDLIVDDLLEEIVRIFNEEGAEVSFNKVLRQEIPQIVICLSCGLTPLNPIVLPCQHLFCQKCIIEHLANELVCPACNEWATYLSTPVNTQYQELITWFSNSNNMEMEQFDSLKQVNGMPIFWFDQQVCVSQNVELAFVEERYLQLIKIACNGSGYFPIVPLVDFKVPMLGNLVKVTKVRHVNAKQINVGMRGSHRILIKEIYTYTDKKVMFSPELYQKLVGQLWICNFDLVEDEISDKEEITKSWLMIQHVMQACFEELQIEMKEIFLPMMQQIGRKSLEDISENSLILVQVMKIPWKEFQQLYYCEDLQVRLNGIWQKIEELKSQLMELIGNEGKKLSANKPIEVKFQNVYNPFMEEEEEEDDGNNDILEFQQMNIHQQLFLNMFHLEKVISSI